MGYYRAVGYIKVMVVSDYEADSLDAAKSAALNQLEVEGQEILDLEFFAEDITDIEVEKL